MIPSLYQLPVLSCTALSGDTKKAASVAGIWNKLYRAANIIDSVEDKESVFSSSHNINHELNEVNKLIFSSELTLSQLEIIGITPGVAKALRLRFNQSILTMCTGQAASFANEIPDLENAWQIVDAKSGEFFALGCYAGARLKTRSKKILTYFWEFGLVIGRLVQISDDIRDLWGNEKGKSDIASSHWGLPITYAMTVLPENEKSKLVELFYSGKMDHTKESTIREIILSCGAIIYLGLETERLRARGLKLIGRACPPSNAREDLISLINSMGFPKKDNYL